MLAAGIPLISAHGAIGAAIALLSAELTLALCYEVSLTQGPPELAAIGGLPPASRDRSRGGARVVVPLGLPSLAAALLGLAIYGGVLSRSARCRPSYGTRCYPTGDRTPRDPRRDPIGP